MWMDTTGNISRLVIVRKNKSFTLKRGSILFPNQTLKVSILTKNYRLKYVSKDNLVKAIKINLLTRERITYIRRGNKERAERSLVVLGRS